MRFFHTTPSMVEPAEALPGRADVMPVPVAHEVTGHSLRPPWPEGHDTIVVALGCFWGAERVFWQLPGVWTTAVGYAGGFTPNPTYEEVCTGRTGHTEAVLVVFDPDVIDVDTVLRAFWEGHDPTQEMRQGNDVGTQYRSACWWTSPDQEAAVLGSMQRYQSALDAAGQATITTEVGPAPEFFYAEPYHQQYLHKVPNGYCGLGGTGVSCPVGNSTSP